MMALRHFRVTYDNGYLSLGCRPDSSTRNDASAGDAPESLQSWDNFPKFPTTIGGYLHSVSANTRRAYQSDISAFLRWGGAIPAHAEMVAQYLVDQAGTLSPHTLARRLVGLIHAHVVLGFAHPCSSELVRATMRGIRRVRGIAQRRVSPLLRDELLKVLELIPNDTRGIRDRALLLVGFAGAFRRDLLADFRTT